MTQQGQTAKPPLWRSLLLGITIGGVFLYLAFRNIELARVWEHIVSIGWGHNLVLAALVVLGVLLRGYRWWYTLPRPHRPGELPAAEGALAVGYAVNNAVPRLGEITRIIGLGRATGRSYTVIASTVVLDRFLLDLLALVAMFAFAMIGYRHHLELMFPEATMTFNALIAVSVVGLGGIIMLALKPAWFKEVLKVVGLTRFETLWAKVENLIDQLSLGMQVMASPKRYVMIIIMTVLIWGSYILVFAYALRLFGIEANGPEIIIVYTFATVGMAIPSPGGVGTYHFLAKQALVQIAHTPETLATAFAVYAHGINYITISLFGLTWFAYQWQKSRRKSHIESNP